MWFAIPLRRGGCRAIVCQRPHPSAAFKLSFAISAQTSLARLLGLSSIHNPANGGFQRLFWPRHGVGRAARPNALGLGRWANRPEWFGRAAPVDARFHAMAAGP